MDVAQRRRTRDFVILVVVAVWLSVLFVAFLVTNPDAGATFGLGLFLFGVVAGAANSRPRPQDRRVWRPIVTGSVLLEVATLTPAAVAWFGAPAPLGLAVGVAIGVAAVFVLRAQVVRIIGPLPGLTRHQAPALPWGPRPSHDRISPTAVALGHALYGTSLAILAATVSTDPVLIVFAELLVLMMLVITLRYVQVTENVRDRARDRRGEVERVQLLLIGWGLFGYLAFLLSVGIVLPSVTLAATTAVFFLLFFLVAGSFWWLRRARSRA